MSMYRGYLHRRRQGTYACQCTGDICITEDMEHALHWFGQGTCDQAAYMKWRKNVAKSYIFDSFEGLDGLSIRL
jgi:hypothetical protein